MDEKQNDNFSGNDKQQQQFEIEVTIKPSISNSNNEHVNQQNNARQSNLAANPQSNQNTSHLINNIKPNLINNLSNTNFQSSTNNVPLFTNMSGFQKAGKISPNNALNLDPAVLLLLKTLHNASLKRNNMISPPPPQQQNKTTLNQPPPPVQQPQNTAPQPNQVHFSSTPKPPSFPQAIQSNNNINFVNKSVTRIDGYIFNKDDHIEYKCIPGQDLNNPQATVNSTPIYCPSSQMKDFETIRQFWLKNNGYNEKQPRQPIDKPKKKKKRSISSYLEYSSSSPPSTPRKNTRDSQKSQFGNFVETKTSVANLPPLLSIDKEPKVKILGVVQKTPIVKIAIKKEDSDFIEVITVAEARRVFPMQLSKFYEQFITFIDYE